MEKKTIINRNIMYTNQHSPKVGGVMKNSWRDINRETQSKKQAATHKKISRKDPKTQLKKIQE